MDDRQRSEKEIGRRSDRWLGKGLPVRGQTGTGGAPVKGRRTLRVRAEKVAKCWGTKPPRRAARARGSRGTLTLKASRGNMA